MWIDTMKKNYDPSKTKKTKKALPVLTGNALFMVELDGIEPTTS